MAWRLLNEVEAPCFESMHFASDYCFYLPEVGHSRGLNYWIAGEVNNSSSHLILKISRA
jgi:hypothetical protein